MKIYNARLIQVKLISINISTLLNLWEFLIFFLRINEKVKAI